MTLTFDNASEFDAGFLIPARRRPVRRYYFDIWDGDHKAHDDIGVECATVHAASVQATIALTELAADLLPGDGPARYLKITVRDEARAVFNLTIDFETAAVPPPKVQ